MYDEISVTRGQPEVSIDFLPEDFHRESGVDNSRTRNSCSSGNYGEWKLIRSQQAVVGV